MQLRMTSTYIVSSEDSTDTGDEEAQKRNKLSNLKMVSTVEEESIRYGLNSIYLTTTFDNNKPFPSRIRLEQRKRRGDTPTIQTCTVTFITTPSISPQT